MAAAAPQARHSMPGHQDIVPMYKERESVRTLFLNGTGDGVVAITHTGIAALVVFIVLAVLAGYRRLLPDGAEASATLPWSPSPSSSLPSLASTSNVAAPRRSLRL